MRPRPAPREEEQMGREMGKEWWALVVGDVCCGAGLVSILDTVSEDTEDTALSCILSVSKIHFSQLFKMASVSEVSKDTDPHVSVY